MKRQSPVLRAIAGGIIAVAALAAAPRARAQYAVFDADAALRVFHERVESYAALHRRLAPPPSAMTSTDPLSKLLTRQYLASAVRSTRRYAQQGDIFTPEIATLFRWMLADSIGELDGESFLTALNGGVPVPRWSPSDRERDLHDGAALPAADRCAGSDCRSFRRNSITGLPPTTWCCGTSTQESLSILSLMS